MFRSSSAEHRAICLPQSQYTKAVFIIHGADAIICMDSQHKTQIDTLLARPGLSPALRLILTRWKEENIVLSESEEKWLEALEFSLRPTEP
jgi:hypothetical protein